MEKYEEGVTDEPRAGKDGTKMNMQNVHQISLQAEKSRRRRLKDSKRAGVLYFRH